MKKKANFFVKEIEELKRAESQVKKARAAAKNVKVSVEKVPVKLRNINPKLFASSFFGVPELNELKALESEAKQLKAFVQKSAKIKVGVSKVKVQKRTLSESLFKQVPNVAIDKSQLKALEKLKVKKVAVIRKGGVSPMFGKQVKIPTWWLNPTGVFKGILLLEEKVKGEDYSGAMDLYLELNQSLQGDTALSVTEKKEVFNRLLGSYKAIRDVFFVPA